MAVADDVYGLLAEFKEAEELRAAALSARAAGYKRLEACTPIPIEGLSDILGTAPPHLPLITLLGGLVGGLSGYALEYYVCVVTNPFNVGGRPHYSWPAFVPVIFEMTVLGAALSAVLGMLLLNGLPRPHHPLFNVPDFKLASRDSFFLCIEARDPAFDLDRTRALLESLSPHGLWEVPR